MSRSRSVESWTKLNGPISCSTVQVSVFNKETTEQIHLGSGIILCDGPECIAVLTTLTCVENCDEEGEKAGVDGDKKKKAGYNVFVRVGDLRQRRAFVFLSGLILSVLVVPLAESEKKNILVLNESSYETNIWKSEPVWAIGCFSKALEQVMPAGYVSISDDESMVKGEAVPTFAHSCPIGDGLIGAPIVNGSGKIIGFNVTTMAQSAKLNHALKFEGLRNQLAKLLLNENDDKMPMSSLVELVRQKVVAFRHEMKLAKQKTDGASSSSATAN